VNVFEKTAVEALKTREAASTATRAAEPSTRPGPALHLR
jgi:hypothetical protein